MFFAKRRFEAGLDQDRILEAIRVAEAGTSGEIRIAIAPFFLGSIETRARRAFRRLGMHKTRLRNGVLIFVAPSRRQFRVLGDEGIHEKVGQAFWDDVATQLTQRFASGAFTDGLIDAVQAVGSELAKHYPPHGPNLDELPNSIARG